MATRRPTSRDSEPRGNIGCILWLFGMVVIFVLFAVNWGEIKATLNRTGIIETIRSHNGAETKKNPVTPAPKVQDKPGAENLPLARSSSPLGEGDSTTSTLLPGSTQTPGETSTTVAVPTREAKLYFVKIDDDGIISRQEVNRSIPITASPLLDSLDALMKGPTEDELRRKLVSLIPIGSRLLSVKIQGSTAILNFNEAFMYNRFGIEGYAGQLKQVVYTATTFPTVQDVQILIEGETRDYLGGEGVFIGRPLSRNSF